MWSEQFKVPKPPPMFESQMQLQFEATVELSSSSQAHKRHYVYKLEANTLLYRCLVCQHGNRCCQQKVVDSRNHVLRMFLRSVLQNIAQVLFKRQPLDQRLSIESVLEHRSYSRTVINLYSANPILKSSLERRCVLSMHQLVFISYLFNLHKMKYLIVP